MKNKTIILFVLVAVLLPAFSCSLARGDKNIKIPVKLERKNLFRSSILVLNFREPGHAGGMGVYMAELFHTGLLQSKKFRVASLLTQSSWDRGAEQEEDRLMDALEEGRVKNYDYILVGELKDFYYGGVNPTRVSFKFRIIEVVTKTTILLVEYDRRSNPKDPTYPLDTQLTKKSLGPRQLAEEMVNDAIKKI